MNNDECREAVYRSPVRPIRPFSVSSEEVRARADLRLQFDQYFEVLQARTPALKLEAYRIRYQVYCREVCLCGFNADNYPCGFECDEFDEQSIHCLLRHRPSDTVAGTVRLVLNKPQHPKQRFPIEQIGGDAVPSDTLEQRSISRANVGEISRFILTQRFRLRQGERQWADGVAPCPNADDDFKNNRRTHLHPVLGLVRAGLIFSAQYGVTYWYAGMEERLNRRLHQFGIFLEPISDTIEYHGECRAYLTHLGSMLRRVYAYNTEVWSLLTDAGRIWPLD